MSMLRCRTMDRAKYLATCRSDRRGSGGGHPGSWSTAHHVISVDQYSPSKPLAVALSWMPAVADHTARLGPLSHSAGATQEGELASRESQEGRSTARHHSPMLQLPS